jgi:hypothetical protein
MSYGEITVGYGTPEQRELKIVDFVQAKFKDHRLISISQIEDGSLTTVVENPALSGRNSQASIWLSKESFVGMLSTAFLYFSAKGEDLGELMKQVIEKDDITYSYSDNLRLITMKTALISPSMSITKEAETVTVLSIDSTEQTALIEYSNGYKETMMLSALTFLD